MHCYVNILAAIHFPKDRHWPELFAVETFSGKCFVRFCVLKAHNETITKMILYHDVNQD